MELRKLIDDGKRLTDDNSPRNEKGQKWIGKAIDYLKKNYPESALTNDFIEEGQKEPKNFKTMVSILQGLNDVEEEIK